MLTGAVRFFRGLAHGECGWQSCGQTRQDAGSPGPSVPPRGLAGWSGRVLGFLSLGLAAPLGLPYGAVAASEIASTPGGYVNAAGTDQGRIVAVTLNVSGNVVVLESQGAGGWQGDLPANQAGGPTPTDMPDTWVDPKDGITYVAYPSTEGLIIYFSPGTAGGTRSWQIANLTALVGGGATPVVLGLAHTIVSGRYLYVFGRDPQGHLVLYYQEPDPTRSAGSRWRFADLTAERLAPAGQPTPAWVTPTVAYSTPWDGINDAGLDAAGQISAVWTAPALAGAWYTTNLSQAYGTPTLAGGLSAYVNWGINLTGVLANGDLGVTWWSRQYEDEQKARGQTNFWAFTNLTAETGGPRLRPESVVGVTTPNWPSNCIYGITEGGDLVAYWWSPDQRQQFGREWLVDNLSARLPGSPLPTGRLTALALADGSIHVMGVSAAGEVLHFRWNASADWQVEHVTGAADSVVGSRRPSVNSTSRNSQEVIPGTTPEALGSVPERTRANNVGYTLVAINDLGMHCGDLDTRVSSILPPFQVLLAQVIQRGPQPSVLGPSQVNVLYSAASNPVDPVLTQVNPDPFRGRLSDGHTYKTNFWERAQVAYDPLYPPGVLGQFYGPGQTIEDVGLPVPNVERLYIGPDGIVDRPGVSSDGALTAVQHAMPGLANPYLANDPQPVQEHYRNKPFFVQFPFGYVADNVNWFEGAGIPHAAYDDFGRENAYPLVRVEAQSAGGNLLATLDTVLPISGEARCKNCHASAADVPTSESPTAGVATQRLTQAGLPVATQVDDPAPSGSLPLDVSIEYATDINVLRLHDLKHGSRYVNSAGQADACVISSGQPNGSTSCLTNRALVQGRPVVCQVCHYTPALDLAQVGPLGGDAARPDASANGRVQRAHPSNSSVMHHHHGSLSQSGFPGLFPAIPAPVQDANGTITNQPARVAALDQSCYQCHPGQNTRCLRGAMFNGGMLCSDCHGSMTQVGDDFSLGVSPTNPSAFRLGLGSFYDPASAQPRVPWANEPGCGSCHTGDATSNLAGGGGVVRNLRDTYGNADNIRLLQAFRTGDARARPIVPANKRFAENTVPPTFNDFSNPGAGNPKLYRVSTGHGGVFCEGCHGATHAEWPNNNPNANDNVTANQLQGHTGTIVECGVCHGDGFAPDGNDALGGPHGMHVVGNTSFSRGGHERLAESNPNACRACHGQTGQGTVLSLAKADRSLSGEERTIQVRRGQPIGCGLCHGNPLD